jgi:peptidoglycan/xylan/chitin deacetylase (PgdA/CDA1 family)
MFVRSRLARAAFVAATVGLLTAVAPTIGDSTTYRATAEPVRPAADRQPTATQPAKAQRAKAQPAREQCTRGVVALTFDDGPRPETTGPILDILIKRHVPATFFVIGEQVPGHGRLLHRMHKHGYRIGNHTYRHEDLTTLSSQQIRSSLRRTNAALRRAGLPAPRLMRPPYGAIDDHARNAIDDLDLTPVLWDVDSRDWDGRTADEIVRSVLGQLDRGRNTVLLHDGVGNSDQTLAALPKLIRKIRAGGYCFTGLNSHGAPRR